MVPDVSVVANFGVGFARNVSSRERSHFAEGAGDGGSICPELDPAHARVLRLPGGHHFDGDYGELVTAVLNQPELTVSLDPARVR